MNRIPASITSAWGAIPKSAPGTSTYTLTFADGESFGIHVEKQTAPRRLGWKVTVYDKDGVDLYDSWDWAHKSLAVSQATAMLVARIEGD